MGKILDHCIKTVKDALRPSNDQSIKHVWTIETKFALGADVWLMWENKPIRAHIMEISLNFQEDEWRKQLFAGTNERYFLNLLYDEGHYQGKWFTPDILYATKEDLLKSL